MPSRRDTEVDCHDDRALLALTAADPNDFNDEEPTLPIHVSRRAATEPTLVWSLARFQR